MDTLTPSDSSETNISASRLRKRDSKKEKSKSKRRRTQTPKSKPTSEADSDKEMTIKNSLKPTTTMQPHWTADDDGKVVEYFDKFGVRYVSGQSAYVNPLLLRGERDGRMYRSNSDYKKLKNGPYMIITINDMRVSAMKNVTIHATSYFRTCDLPENCLHLLWHERHTTFTSDHKETELPIYFKSSEHQARELFQAIGESQINTDPNGQPLLLGKETFPATALAGICQIKHIKSFSSLASPKKALKPMKLEIDTFYYILGYNPETKRLMSNAGDVRIKASHEWSAYERGLFQKATTPSKLSNWEFLKNHQKSAFFDL